MSPVRRRELLRRLRALGFEGPHPGGKHQYMVRDSAKVRVPNPHGSKDVSVHIQHQILSQLQLSVAEWEEL